MPTSAAPVAPRWRWIAGAAAAPACDYDADIIILAFERVAQTLAALRSALAQGGVSRHIFVLDQGSTPASLDCLAAALHDRPDATLVQASHNLGVAGGRNVASALGHGRVIAAIDSDAEFADTTTLARAVAAIDADAALAAIGCRIVVHATGGDDLTSWGYPMALLGASTASFDATTFVGAGHAIRRAAWIDAGGYDEALFFCWEEYDFCLRAINRGWRVRYRGDLVVRHKISPEQRVAWSGVRWFLFVRNRLYVGRKWGTGWPALAPRYAGYLLKGARNGLILQTLRALPAAQRMAACTQPCRLSDAGRAYLHAHDTIWRGPAWRRLQREILVSLPSA